MHAMNKLSSIICSLLSEALNIGTVYKLSAWHFNITNTRTDTWPVLASGPPAAAATSALPGGVMAVIVTGSTLDGKALNNVS